MPLSKQRDKDRKQVERTRNRLDKQLRPSQISKPVQPKPKRRDQMEAEEQGITGHDAEGYPLYDG